MVIAFFKVRVPKIVGVFLKNNHYNGSGIKVGDKVLSK